MQKLILAIGTALLLLHGEAHSQQKSHLYRILESGVLRVGTTGDSNPMSFRNPTTNEYQGFDIDMARELAKDMGVKVEFVPTDWKSIVQGIVADKYDVTSSVSYTPQRAKVAGYTLSYFGTASVPMTLKANLGRYKAGWADVDKPDVTVAVTLGTVFEMEAHQYLTHAKIKTDEAPAREYQEVLANRADAFITSNLEASTLIKTYPQLAVIPVDKPRARKPQAMLAAQDDQIWLNYLNGWIIWKRENNYFDELEKKWMGEGWSNLK